MKLLRIAFGYQSRVGKDTACLLLQQKYGGNIYNFSKSLYDILYHAQSICGFPKEKDPKFLQWVGTEWARSKDPNVWINKTFENIDWSNNCFISDLRFKNEMDYLSKNGFITIKIIRDDRPIDRNPLHQSENDLNSADWDYTIINNGSISDLEQKLTFIVEQKLHLFRDNT